MKHLVALAGIILLVGAGVAVRSKREASPKPRRIAADRTETPTRLAPPREIWSQPSIRPAAVEFAEPEPEPVSEEVEQQPAARDLEAEEREAEHQRHEQRSYLEMVFAERPWGDSWSRDTASMIKNALVPVINTPGVVLESVDCREALCRIEVATRSEADYDQMFAALTAAHWHFGGGPAFLTRDDSNGTTEGLVMFVGRQGEDLPQLPTSD